MSFPYEINKVLLGDGLLFLAQGFLTFMSPNPQRLLKDKVDTKIALPPFKDVRRAMGAGYMGMGLIVIGIGYCVTKGSDLNSITIFRALSLMPVVYAGAVQLLGKKWKTSGSLILFTALYAILILIYLFFGIVDPPAYPNVPIVAG
jgi:hypothetical protein